MFSREATGAGALTSHSPTTVVGHLRKSAGWIYAYTAIQFACQLALLTKELAPARVVFRSAVFGASILFLFVVSGTSRQAHPVRGLAFVTMIIVTLSAFNPGGGAPLAVAAHWAMYLAVLGPLFWVARLKIGEKQLERLMLVLWVFHTVSSIFGLLQVYFPGQFQPALTTFITAKQAMMIRLSSGEWVVRPMGLTDVPGGAAHSGLYAALIGTGVVLTRSFSGARVLGLLSMTTGMACIYLSQVRAALVMVGVSFAFLVALFAVSARLPRVAGLLLFGGAVVFVGFELAFDVAGDTVTSRLASLVASDPGTVYRSNRGAMVEDAFSTLLPNYPLGAGLGHWGMMKVYFGSGNNDFAAEIQWVGWILDGGIVLVLVYAAAVLTVLVHAARLCLRHSLSALGIWAAIIAAYNVGMLALCFSYVPFMGTPGLEFWLINAVLIQAASSIAENRIEQRAAGAVPVAQTHHRVPGHPARSPIGSA